jgi:hypothetical protein
MRHSQQTASKNYLKVSNIDKLTPNEKIKELSKENIILNKLINELNVKLKTYEKTPEHGKEHTKKRNDILYLLNKGRQSKPETLTKYNILYNDQTNKYY